jgi:hypothetical protein
MFLVYKKSYNLFKNFNIYILNKKAILYIKGLYGIIELKLPSYYFFYKNNNIFSLLFIEKNKFINVMKHFFYNYNYLFMIYCVRIKIKGLGYRIRKVSKQLYYFFFNYTNMYYIYIPKSVLVK